MEHSFDETGQGEVHGDHTAGIFKGLSALTGIYLFFLIEKTMQIRRVRKEKRVSDCKFFKESNKIFQLSFPLFFCSIGNRS